MVRGKKEGHYINCFVSQQVYDKLEDFVRSSGQSKTRVVEKAIELYIKKWHEKFGDAADIMENN